MRPGKRTLVVLLLVTLCVSLSSIAIAKSTIVAVYFPHIVDCNSNGGWFVTVTNDEGVSNTVLLCDGGLIP